MRRCELTKAAGAATWRRSSSKPAEPCRHLDTGPNIPPVDEYLWRTLRAEGNAMVTRCGETHARRGVPGPLVVALMLCLTGLTGCEDPAREDAGSSTTRSELPKEKDRGREKSQRREEKGDARRQAGTRARPRSPTPPKATKKAEHRAGRNQQQGAPKLYTTRMPPRTYLVTRVIDGDTVELGNGETVRLVGIDTPEVGQCGYDQAAANLERLVLFKHVRLTISDEYRDHYGRLLRYVDVGNQDAGLRLVENGVAIARYDSRDGYGYHPREPRYVAADRASQNIGCPKPAAPPRRLVGGGGNCAAGYKPCIPPYPPDLDCADVNGPIYVTGTDLHWLDGEGDGIGCE